MTRAAVATVLLLALASAAAARPVGLRSLLQTKEPTKDEPIYCSGVDDPKGECPEGYTCKATKEPKCEDVEDCVKDKNGKDKCTTRKECREFLCYDIPGFCDPALEVDACAEKHGPELKCKKLDKEECVMEKECKKENTHCERYNFEDECEVVNGDCLMYGQDGTTCKEYQKVNKCGKVRKGCALYGQEEVCKDVKVCWKGKCSCVKKDCYEREPFVHYFG